MTDMASDCCCRFDILCVVKDTVDREADGRLAEFVVNSHMRSHPNADPAAVRPLPGPKALPLDRHDACGCAVCHLHSHAVPYLVCLHGPDPKLTGD